MDVNKGREMVQGISRFYEMLWIERNDKGLIARVYDRDNVEVDKICLHRSFICVAAPGGFLYKGEFIQMENENEAFKKRALNLQRRKRNHPKDRYT